jgi:hypothetical protein
MDALEALRSIVRSMVSDAAVSPTTARTPLICRILPLYVDFADGMPAVSAAQDTPSIFAVRTPEPVGDGGGGGMYVSVGSLSCVHPFITQPTRNRAAIAICVLFIFPPGELFDIGVCQCTASKRTHLSRELGILDATAGNAKAYMALSEMMKESKKLEDDDLRTGGYENQNEG